MKRCGAKTRKKTPCQKPPLKGRNRCGLHGGKSLRGVKSGRYQYGLYSKYAGDSVKGILEELEKLPSEELLDADHEIRLLQALIVSGNTLQSNFSDLDDLEKVSRVLDRLVTAKLRSHKLKLEQSRLVPVTDVQAFIIYVEKVLRQHIQTDTADSIVSQILRFRVSDNETLIGQ